MDERRLHFPIHGTRLSGNGDPARGVGEAARLLYFVNLIAQTAGVPVFQLSRQTPYGMVAASVHGPLAFKSVLANEEPEEEDQEEEATASRLVWLPEGFVLTPRTPGAPDGFGMPPTPDGKGTQGGPLRQVIINKFKDNQYPDAVYRWAIAINSAAADATDVEIATAAGKVPAGTVFAANLFFMDWELDDEEFGIGVMDEDEDEVLPQFDRRWVPNYRELKSDDWHCHRPQHHLLESDMEALIRQETNLIREGAAKPPLGKPLRGTTGELSQNIAYQIRMSGVMGHGSLKFKEGHQTPIARYEERTAFDRTFGENLYMGAPADVDATFVRAAMDGWTESPGHYENMVYDWSDDGERYAWIDPAISESGEAADGGALGVQIFHGAGEWVAAPPGIHDTRPPVGVPGPGGQDLFVSIYPVDNPTTDEFWPYVTYRGRVVYLTTEAVNRHAMEVLSATTLIDDDDDDADAAPSKLRVAVLLRPQNDIGPVYFVIYEGAAHDFLATRAEVARYQLPGRDANFIARPQWSASGAKAAFCYTKLVPVPAGYINPDMGGTSVGIASGVFGQTVHFMEFRGGALYGLYDEQLTITPLAFGPEHHSQECHGSCKFLAAYQGETLVFVTLDFDGSSSQDRAGAYEKSIKGVLNFPDGKSLTYVDIWISTADVPPGYAAVHGFVRHLLPFDIMDPDGIAYLQYDLPADDSANVTGKLMIRGEQVKFAPDPMRRQALGRYGIYAPDGYLRANRIATLSAHRGITDAVSFDTRIINAYVPSVPYPAAVVSFTQETAPRPMPRGPYIERAATMEYVLAGPTLLRGTPFIDLDQNYGRLERYSYARYKGEWLYAGRIENTLGGIGTKQSYVGGAWIDEPRGAWLGDDQYYHHSSLDLKAITGLPDLKDNILPIGVL